jgi:hypothetical protein
MSVMPYTYRDLQVNATMDDPADRVRAFLSQVCCRHSYIRRATSGRLYLECLECCHTTAGIAVHEQSASNDRADTPIAS